MAESPASNRPLPSPVAPASDRPRVSTRAAAGTDASKSAFRRFGSLASAFTKRLTADPAQSYRDRRLESFKSRQLEVTASNVVLLNGSVDLQDQQNDLLARIIAELKGLNLGDEGSGPGRPGRRDRIRVRASRVRGGQRGRFGPRARARLQRIQQIRQNRIRAERAQIRGTVRPRAVPRVEGVRPSPAVAPRPRIMPVLDIPPVRDTASTRTTTVDSESERIRPPTSRPPERPPEPETPRVRTPTITRTTPDQVVDDTQRIPAQTAPSTDAERVGQRTVAGRTVVFNDANYNRTLQGIRIAGAVGLVVGAMGIAQQVSELYALRQMNQQDPSEGITEEEFQKELANIAGSVLGGVAGAYLGAKVGGFIGGLTGGPWGALAGGITGGVFGGLTGESTGELIGAAIFDQLTGSNTFEELWNRRQDEARRNLAAGASTLGAEPETVAERIVQQQQAQQEQQQRRLAGIDQPFANPELERVIRDLQTARRNLQGNPTNRRLQNVVANQERGLRNLLNSRSFRVTDEDRQRAQSFLDGRTELQDTPANSVTDNLVTPSSFSVADTATQPSINAVSIIQLLSGAEFNSIKIEASRIEFDGKIEVPGQTRVIQYATRITAPTVAPVASTEITPAAPTITPTAPTASAASRPAPGGGGVLSRLGRSIIGGRTQASPSAPSPAPAQQTSVTPVTPSIGGDSGTGGGSTGSITEIIERGPGFNVVKYDDGRVERRTGARNWRNNNPGNIEFGDLARRQGAIGTDGRFAIFPTYEIGKRAKEALLFEGRNYSGLTIAQAITRYAPPSENDTAMYIRVAAAAAGVSPGTPMQSLNSEQRRALLSAMERVEGFRIGSVQVIQQGTAVASAEQAPPGPGPTLAAAGTQMAVADQAQARGQGQEVVVQVPAASPQQRIAAVEQQVSSGARGEVSLNRRLEKQVA